MSANWEYPKREEQSLYEAVSLNSTSTTVVRKNSDNHGFRTVARPNIPFTNYSEYSKEKRNSPGYEYERQGQEIRRKVSNYFAKCHSSFDPAEFQPINSLPRPQEKHDSNAATDEQGSFYSGLFSEKAKEEVDVEAPMFLKKKQLDFPQETMTPKF